MYNLYSVVRSGALTFICILAVSLLGFPSNAHALLMDTGINTGYQQLGDNGTEGGTGYGGLGGKGAVQGPLGQASFIGPNGGTGGLGGTGGRGGTGGTAAWTIDNVFTNMGVVNAGGDQGRTGESGAQGADGYRGGNGQYIEWSNGTVLFYNARIGWGPAGGRPGNFFHPDGYAGGDGTGSGGGGGYSLFGVGGRGGNGAKGVGGTPTHGVQGAYVGQTTSSFFTNSSSGTVQIGGNGGGGGMGGQGGQGGGGAGGLGGATPPSTDTPTGGHGGYGGKGGAGGPGGAPGVGKVFVNGSFINDSGSVDIRHDSLLRVNGGGTVENTNGGSISLEDAGRLDVSGGELFNRGGSVDVGDNCSLAVDGKGTVENSNGGNISLDSAGTLDIPGGELLNRSGSVAVGNSSILEVDTDGRLENWKGGNIVVDGSSSLQSNKGATLVNGGAIWYKNGVPGGSPFNNQGVFSNSGFFIGNVKNNGDISNSGSFVGNVENQGDFGGAGTVIGDVTNGVSGILAPGDTPGSSMTIVGNYSENGLLDIQFGGPNGLGYDSLDVYGNVDLGASSLLDVDLLGTFNQAGLADGDYFDIVCYSGALTGLFGGIDDTGVPLSSGLWSLDYGYNLGGGLSSLRLVYGHGSVPEPSTLLLLGVGLLALIAIRKISGIPSQG